MLTPVSCFKVTKWFTASFSVGPQSSIVISNIHHWFIFSMKELVIDKIGPRFVSNVDGIFWYLFYFTAQQSLKRVLKVKNSSSISQFQSLELVAVVWKMFKKSLGTVSKEQISFGHLPGNKCSQFTDQLHNTQSVNQNSLMNT